MSQWVDIDQGFQPSILAFCGSKKAWRKGVKRYGYIGQEYPPQNAPAVCTRLYGGVKDLIIITMRKPPKGVSDVEIMGILVHECLHMLDYILDGMGERDDAREFRAYTLQAIFMAVLTAYADCHGGTK